MSSLDERRSALQQALSNSAKAGWNISDSSPNGEVHAERHVGNAVVKIAGQPNGMWEVTYTHDSSYHATGTATGAVEVAHRWA